MIGKYDVYRVVLEDHALFESGQVKQKVIWSFR